MLYTDGKQVDTHCCGCVFAQYEMEDETPTQYGCFANKLSQYEENGVQLIEACNEAENYFIIPKKVCAMQRTKEWAVKNKSINLKDCVDLAEEEVARRLVDVVVIYNENTKEEYLTNILNQLDKQTVAPAKVHFMVIRADDESYRLPPGTYISWLEKFKFQWQFHHVLDHDLSYGDIINQIGDKCNSYYYAVFRPTFLLQANFVERLFERTYRQLKPFSLILSTEPFNGLVVQSAAHRLVQGNGTEKSAAGKIKELAEEQNLPDAIITFEELMNDN